MVVTAFLMVSCGSSVDSSPLIYLVSNGELADGFQGPYCWDKGAGGALCVDPIQPYFDETIRFPASGPIQFLLDEPLPDEVTLSLSRELFGDNVISEKVSVTENMDWYPDVDAGEYILTVGAKWPQGDVVYWFSIVLE